MPSPSCQNLRSAPQKQPSPNTACSRPAGYGGCSLRPLTKWVVAVGIGVARPGSASAALGNAVVLRMNNMDNLQAGPAAVETPSAGCLYIYMSLRRLQQPRYTGPGGRNSLALSPAHSRSAACAAG